MEMGERVGGRGGGVRQRRHGRRGSGGRVLGEDMKRSSFQTNATCGALPGTLPVPLALAGTVGRVPVHGPPRSCKESYRRRNANNATNSRRRGRLMASQLELNWNVLFRHGTFIRLSARELALT